jgi:hypothetical protein
MVPKVWLEIPAQRVLLVQQVLTEQMAPKV